ncbi:MAG: hypothetical protein WCT14_18450 [Treponemataceae bacterium]
MRRSFALIITIVGIFTASPLGAAEGLSYIYRASVLTILEDNGLSGDPAPILFSPGFAVALPLLSFIKFEPGLDLYFTYYGYATDLGRAVPIALENRSAAVYGFMLNLPLDFSFRIAKLVGFHASVGMTADLRLCLVADGLDNDAQGLADATAQTGQVASYFWGAGRWLYPSASIGFDFPFTKNYFLGVDLRAWYPLYHLWSGENLPVTENLRFALGLRLSYSSR